MFFTDSIEPRVSLWLDRHGIRSLQSFASHEERGRRRIYRAGLTGVATLAVRGATTVIGVVSIPLLAQYLGSERLGLWLTLSTMLSWGGLADLGIALSLVNAVATADGKGDREAARHAVSSAFFLLSGVGGILAVAFILVNPAVPWDRVFNVVSGQARAEAGPAMMVGMLYFAARLPLGVASQVFTAYQEGYRALVWVACGAFTGLVALTVGISLGASLPVLVALYFGSLALGDVVTAAHLFTRRRTYLRPRWSLASWPVASVLLRRGMGFWIATASAVLFTQLDLIIVAQLFGAAAAAEYGTAIRLIALIGAVQIAFIHPLWPSYNEALARRDVGWIRRTFNQSIRISMIWVLPMSALILVAGPTLVQVISRSNQSVPFLIIVAITLTEVANAISRCISTVLNGLGRLRSQLTFVPVGIIVKLALSLLLARAVGPAGVAFSTCFCLVVFWIGIIGRDAARSLAGLAET